MQLGKIFSDYGQILLPINLEMQLFIKNGHFWEETVINIFQTDIEKENEADQLMASDRIIDW